MRMRSVAVAVPPRVLSRNVACALACLLGGSAAQAQLLPQVPTQPVPSMQPDEPIGPTAGAAPQGAASAPQPAGPPPTRYLVPSLALLLTHTSNANLGTSASARADTLLEIVPRLFAASEHARWRVVGDVQLDATHYNGGTQADVVSPAGYAALHAEPVERTLYFDAGMNTRRNAINAYVGQDGPVQGSSYTSTQWRIAPYVERQLRPGLQLRLRSDDTWTTVSNTPSGAAVAGGRYLDHSLGLAQAPQPWGYELQAQQTYATYDQQPYAWFRDNSARATLNHALTPHLVLGAGLGVERLQAAGAQENGSIVGVRVRWDDGTRAHLNARVEHRFFGTGWDLAADAGGAASRLSLAWRRDVVSGLAPIGSSAELGGNLGSLLDGMLSGQIPNPLQRAQAVNELLGSAGLPGSLPSSGGYFTASTQLQDSLALHGVLLWPRDSYAASLYRLRSSDLFLPGQQWLQLVAPLSADNRQTGVAMSWGHRLAPIDELHLTLQREIDTGIGRNTGRSARQSSAIVQLDHRLSPRSIAIVGVRRRLLRSSVTGVSNETAVFAGLVHRF